MATLSVGHFSVLIGSQICVVRKELLNEIAAHAVYLCAFSAGPSRGGSGMPELLNAELEPLLGRQVLYSIVRICSARKLTVKKDSSYFFQFSEVRWRAHRDNFLEPFSATSWQSRLRSSLRLD